MKQHPIRASLILALVLILIMGSVALAAEGLPTIDWWVFGSGGGPSSGGDVTLNDTIGQPFVGPSSGGDVSLQAGYWVGGTAAGEGCSIYLPLLLR
jgi:hypothetical protein